MALPVRVRQVTISLACICSAVRQDHWQPAAAANVQDCVGPQQGPVQVLTCLELAGAGPAVPGTGCTECHWPDPQIGAAKSAALQLAPASTTPHQHATWRIQG